MDVRHPRFFLNWYNVVTMKIKNSWIEKQSGLEATAEYEDVDDFSALPCKDCASIACLAFYNDKLLLVNHKDIKWTPPGGGIESNESFEEAAKRELMEEADVEVIKYKPIGYQKAYLSKDYPDGPMKYQLRVYCEVRPVRDFSGDPDGDIIEIKFIDPKDYKKYFDWGTVGDRLIERALEIHNGETL